ncbi:hypothetical protein GUITHDRAFT_53038, partial [Guillardia theta CCMP2712]
VAGGGAHSLALSCDGCVYAWGANTSGQASEMLSRLSVTTFGPGVMQVAAGNRHSLALMADGRVFAWGQNVFGQLGIGKNFTQRTTSLPPSWLITCSWTSKVISVAAGGSHSLALLQDGTVMSWGSNDHGQLGNGKFTALLGMGEWHDALIPTESLVREEVVDVCAGYQHSLALLKDGRVMAWGSNEAGQLGVDDEHEVLSSSSLSPWLPARVVQVAAGFASSLAVLEDGRVFSWGANYDGQLGNGSRSEQPRFPLKI